MSFLEGLNTHSMIQKELNKDQIKACSVPENQNSLKMSIVSQRGKKKREREMPALENKSISILYQSVNFIKAFNAIYSGDCKLCANKAKVKNVLFNPMTDCICGECSLKEFALGGRPNDLQPPLMGEINWNTKFT